MVTAVRDAEQTIQGMIYAGITPDVGSYSTVIHACVRAQEPERAEYWLTEMIAQDEPASVFCYNSVVQAWASANEVAKAEKWLEKVS